MKQIFVKPEQCLGCRSCEIGCAVQHSEGKSLFAAMAERPLPLKRIFVESGGKIKMPVLCRQCEEAPCLSSCISGSLYRDETGMVNKREEKCIGCWTCIMVCPFGVVRRSRDRELAIKCDRCGDLDVPACVNACPTGALLFIDADDMSRERRKKIVLEEAERR